MAGTDEEWEDDGRQPCSVKQRWDYCRIAMVMAAVPVRTHHPIEDRNGDKDDDASHPTLLQLDIAPNSEECEQDGPDATQERMLVEQEEPKQE